ncbi:hypothetical protein Pmani_035621 [Petrolisthes manimaculis]|uniref:Uncharacterized protein n=1 Tax=Petrolisthes manimaculis TaxID=1843537 RepID=A0AAE1TNI6_9EUCA|nr:hypothetical protein Pmani_035621 [Petrolisthes manimaculis]
MVISNNSINVSTMDNEISTPSQVQCLGNTENKFRVRAEPHFLLASPTASQLTLGHYTATNTHACFRVHIFSELSVNPVDYRLVALETMVGGRHLYGSPTGNNIYIRPGSENLSTLTETDDRFFRLFQQPGDRYHYLRHHHSGKIVAASGSEVTLVDHPGAPQTHMLFEKFPCTTNTTSSS